MSAHGFPSTEMADLEYTPNLALDGAGVFNGFGDVITGGSVVVDVTAERLSVVNVGLVATMIGSIVPSL